MLICAGMMRFRSCSMKHNWTMCGQRRTKPKRNLATLQATMIDKAKRNFFCSRHPAVTHTGNHHNPPENDVNGCGSHPPDLFPESHSLFPGPILKTEAEPSTGPPSPPPGDRGYAPDPVQKSESEGRKREKGKGRRPNAFFRAR